jgi:hypothetical protein
MIVLNQDGIASRIVPTGMAPIDRSATHHDRQQDGDRVCPQMPAEQHQVHDGVQFTLVTSPPRVNAERNHQRSKATSMPAAARLGDAVNALHVIRDARRTAAIPPNSMATAELVAHQNARTRAGRIQTSMRS